MEAETAMARYRGGKYLRWAWKPTTVTPFWGLTTFKGEWIIGLYPLVIEIGIRQRVMWERLDLDPADEPTLVQVPGQQQAERTS